MSSAKTVALQGVPVSAVTNQEIVSLIKERLSEGVGGYVCVENVHMFMLARGNAQFRQVLEDGLLCIPDGMPLVWLLRRMGFRGQPRTTGPDLMLSLCELASEDNIAVALVGGSDEVRTTLEERLRGWFPKLRVVFSESPSVAASGVVDDQQFIERARASGAQLWFVGLGCPKQENWMARHNDRLAGIFVGVGAAFDYHAGRLKRAPSWMQQLGLEWFFRLLQDPRKLWKRYFVFNTLFTVNVMIPLVVFGNRR